MPAIVLKTSAGADAPYNFYQNSAGTSTTYIGLDHTDLSVDKLVVNTSAPNRRSTDYGNRRSRANLQRGVNVASPDGSTVNKNAKILVDASVPVGMTIEQFTELCARQAALLSNPVYVRAFFMLGQTEL